MTMSIRIPKPAYLRSRLAPRARPDAAWHPILAHLAELYELGEIVDCYRWHAVPGLKGENVR